MDKLEARATIKDLRAGRISAERAQRLLSPDYILIWKADRLRGGTGEEDGSGKWVAQKRYNWTTPTP